MPRSIGLTFAPGIALLFRPIGLTFAPGITLLFRPIGLTFAPGITLLFRPIGLTFAPLMPVCARPRRLRDSFFLGAATPPNLGGEFHSDASRHFLTRRATLKS